MRLVLFFLLISSNVHAWDGKLDLSRRIQFVPSPDNKVIFQDCTLDTCTTIASKWNDINSLAELFLRADPSSHAGAAYQLLADAGHNRLKGSPRSYGVVGTIVGGEKSSFAICGDKSILERLKGKTKQKDYAVELKNVHCTLSGSGARTMQQEVEWLKQTLAQPDH